MYLANFETVKYDGPTNEQCGPPIAPPCRWQGHCREAQRHDANQRTCERTRKFIAECRAIIRLDDHRKGVL
eukprot:5796822-Pleurochrysis_carterae.AAC.1